MAHTIIGITGLNTKHRWELALRQFSDASALIMQGNMLVGIIENKTSDGYLAVPIKIRAIERYKKGSAAELKAAAARFPEAHRLAPSQELIEQWLEGDGYDCIPATLEAVLDQVKRSAYVPGIRLLLESPSGQISNSWVEQRPASYHRMMSERAILLEIDQAGKLFTFDPSVKYWDSKNLWMLYRHSKDLVIRLPLDNLRTKKIARSMLESPLTFQKWKAGLSTHDLMDKSFAERIQSWLFDVLGCSMPVVTSETVAIAGIHIPTPDWIKRGISKLGN